MPLLPVFLNVQFFAARVTIRIADLRAIPRKKIALKTVAEKRTSAASYSTRSQKIAPKRARPKPIGYPISKFWR